MFKVGDSVRWYKHRDGSIPWVIVRIIQYPSKLPRVELNSPYKEDTIFTCGLHEIMHYRNMEIVR